MPNPGAERPLRKVTLNLFEEDCVTFETGFGQGWTTKVRELVHSRAEMMRKPIETKYHNVKRTLGDLE